MQQNGQYTSNNNSAASIITTNGATTTSSSMIPIKSDKTKKYRQWLGIVAMILAFLLIAGAIILHLKQKSHLGRLHVSKSSSSSSSSVGSSSSSPSTASISSSSSGSTIDGLTNDYDSIVHIIPGIAADAPALPPKENSKEMIIDDYEYYEDEDILKQPETTTSTVPLKMYLQQQQQKPLRSQVNISDACLQCICEATTECKPVDCRGTPCGPYRISKPYWTDAAPKGAIPTNDYETCVNDFSCARSVVAAYIHKYARDCTDDGIIDCRDHTALHILGPSGCMSKETSLLPIFEFRMSRCFIQQGIFFD